MDVRHPFQRRCLIAMFLFAVGACLVLPEAGSVTSADEPAKIAIPPDAFFSPRGIAVKGDGKILEAGGLHYSESKGRSVVSRNFFGLARYRADGTPDTTFGDGGFAVLDGSGGAVCVATDMQDRIVAGGYIDRKAAVVRLSANGQLDKDFGKNGIAAPDEASAQSAEALTAEKKLRSIGGINFGNGFSSINAVAQSPSGEIFAATSADPYEVLLFSLKSDGSPNTAIGGQGFVRTEFKSSDGAVVSADPGSLLLLGDGRLLIGGSGVVQKPGLLPKNALVLARYLQDGRLDPAFGNGGKVIRDLKSAGGYFYSMALAADGKLLVAGSLENRFVVFRYAQDGTLDSDFGQSGEVLLDVPYSPQNGSNDRIQYIGQQAGNNVLVTGFFSGGKELAIMFFAAKLKPDGSPDTAFASEGKLTYKLPKVTSSGDAASAVDGSGDVVVTYMSFRSRNVNVLHFDNSGHLSSTVLAGERDRLERIIEKEILKNGQDINGRDDRGDLPLGNAARRHSKEIVAQLIAMGANIDGRDKQGRTALMEVVGDVKRKEITELLLSKGADVNAKNSFGQTALDFAIQRDAKEIILLLLAGGADVDARNNGGATPLMGSRSKEVVQTLLAKGADINARDNHDRTALMLQASYGNKDVVQALLAAGAQVDIRSDKGATALSMAEKNGHAAVAELLKKSQE